MRATPILLTALLLAVSAGDGWAQQSYGTRAREVTAHIQKTFWNAESGLYKASVSDQSPAMLWDILQGAVTTGPGSVTCPA